MEEAEGQAARFKKVDELVGRLVVRALNGERVVNSRKDGKHAVLELAKLSRAERQVLNDTFSLAQQQAHGAWFLPEQASIGFGVLNFPSQLRNYPRHAMGIALEECGRTALAKSADAVLVWSLLEPFFSELFRPFDIRGPSAGIAERETALEEWRAVDETYAALNLNVATALSKMHFGSGWSKLAPDQQVGAKQRLMDALVAQVDVGIGSRYRALRIKALLQKYYAKAKDGRAQRRQVITKQLAPILAGFFGGDWLAWLDYVGEAPHPDEKISTALPEPRLYVGGEQKVLEAAARTGIAADEVQRILKSYWANSGGSSPVHRRVSVLARYWKVFDEIHARQEPGMRPLWGLVEEGGLINLDDVWRAPYQTGLFRELLPADLLADVEELWGSSVLAKWPDRVVSEQYPHAAMAEALGPCLAFWHGVALTAWFICEGPSSRTDMAGLAKYHARHLQALSDLGYPIADSLFGELVEAEARLGPPQPIVDERTMESGMSFSMQLGQRRGGFPGLRNIITKHRRAWTAPHFDGYLRALWETELRRASYEYNVLSEQRGKAPTLKQFAKHATGPSNHWFGGDVTALYAALGLKAPAKQERRLIMPVDRVGFAWTVFQVLGGRPFHRMVVVDSRADANRQGEEQQRNHAYKRLAEESLWYLQLQEVLGRSPDLDDFGASKFEKIAAVVTSDAEQFWPTYVQAIEQAKVSPQPAPEQVKSTPVFVGSPRHEGQKEVAPAEERDSVVDRPPPDPDPPKRSWLSRLLGRK